MSNTKSNSWWGNLSPAHKQYVIFGGLGAGLLAVSFMMTSGKNSSSTDAPETKQIENILGSKTDGKELGLQQVSTDLTSQEARIREQDQRMREMADMIKELKAGGGTNSAGPTDEQLAALRENLQTAQNGIPLSGSAATVPVAPSKLEFRTFENTSDEPEVAPATGNNSNQSNSPGVAKEEKKNTIYLPAGTMVSGVLITGLDAPTGRSASTQPIPVLIRVKHEGLLPSRRSVDLREAFILASGFGDLASERTYLRSERLSMVLANGNVIDVAVEMSAVGSDGRAGLRSRLVSKQAKAMRRAVMAGLADGVSRTLQQTYTLQQSGQNGQPVDSNAAGAAVLANGGSSALDRISQYYLNLADQTYPVLETPAGREITFILLKGVELPLDSSVKPPRF